MLFRESDKHVIIDHFWSMCCYLTLRGLSRIEGNVVFEAKNFETLKLASMTDEYEFLVSKSYNPVK